MEVFKIKTKYKVIISALLLMIILTTGFTVKTYNESSRYESKSESLATQLNASKEEVINLEGRVDELKISNNTLASENKKVSENNNALKQEIKTLEETIDERIDEIKSLEAKVFDEKYSRLKSLDQLNEDDFVDIGQIDPLIKQDKYFLYNEIYDSEGNKIIGQQHNVMALRYGTAKRLKLANSILNEQGYGIVLYEAYRSYGMQAKLNEHYKFLNGTDEGDRTYVAAPGASKHQKGVAVDIGLYSLETNEILDMPTDYLALDDSANVYQYMNQATEEAEHLKILQNAMEEAGCSIYAGEWWHFNDLTLVEAVEPYQGKIYDILVGIK